MAKRNSLYEKLGIEPTADIQEIKKSYRRKAKKTHPDSGGSEEEFNEVHKAYAVLSNPLSRKKYDATGDESLQEPDNEQQQVMLIIVGVLEAVITYLEQNMKDPLKYDIVSDMKKRIKSEIDKQDEHIRNLNILSGKTKKLLGRFKVKKGNNFIEKMLNSKINSIAENIRLTKDRIEPMQKAYDLLKDVEFDFDRNIDNPYQQNYGILADMLRYGI